MRNLLLGTFIIVLFAALVGCQNNEYSIVVPSEQQREWAQKEIGVLIHFDMPCYSPEYNWRQFGTHPDAKTFNPTNLNTDQWMEAAQKIGATYAVLVAKHCSGFSLWPTAAHEYSIKNSPWRDGKGDIVADFIASCKKYNIKPGIYASTTANGFCHVDNPGKVQPGSPYTQEQYNNIVETQLTELWTNYGELFEVWFDGGVMPKAEGGANVLSLLDSLQPNAVAFQGPFGAKNLIRWVGNEEGFSPDPCWATADSTTTSSGVIEVTGMHGNPDAPFWSPGEADFTLRLNSSFQGGWFWAKGQDSMLYSTDQLLEKYCSSVGRNTNMLLGIVIDSSGQVPAADMQRLEEFGAKIKDTFYIPLARNYGQGEVLKTYIESPSTLRYIILREDIAKGERVLEYVVKATLKDGSKKELYRGTNIGNCRIIKVDGAPVVKDVTLNIIRSKSKPYIAELGLY